MGICSRRLFLWSPKSRNLRTKMWHFRPQNCHSWNMQLHNLVYVSSFMRPSITCTLVVLVGFTRRLESVWWLSRPWSIVLASRLRIVRRCWPAAWMLRVPPGHRDWQSSKTSEKPELVRLRASRRLWLVLQRRSTCRG